MSTLTRWASIAPDLTPTTVTPPSASHADSCIESAPTAGADTPLASVPAIEEMIAVNREETQRLKIQVAIKQLEHALIEPDHAKTLARVCTAAETLAEVLR